MHNSIFFFLDWLFLRYFNAFNLQRSKRNCDIKIFHRGSRYLFYNRRTKLCNLFVSFGSDKALYRPVGRHNYSTLYYKLLSSFRFKEFNLLELGIGTTNPHLSSNMGLDGTPGASLYSFQSFFEKAMIYGADIDSSILINEDRIRCFFCDQTNSESVQLLWRLNFPDKKFKIIIDDGLHEFEANKNFMENSIYKLDADGFYFIEDVLTNELKLWNEYLSKNSSKFFYFIFQIPNPVNKYDNNLLLLRPK